AEVDYRNLRCKGEGAEVRLVDAHERGSLIADRLSVVLDACSIRCTDLDQPNAGGSEDLRNPKGPPDLDELTAGDHHFPTAPDRGDGQHHGGGVVVDRNGGLGTGQ